MPFPSRSETEAILVGLATGSLTPSQASAWAHPFVIDETTHPERMDTAVRNALPRLVGADLIAAAGEPLHGPRDFEEWLAQFRANVRSIR